MNIKNISWPAIMNIPFDLRESCLQREKLELVRTLAGQRATLMTNYLKIQFPYVIIRAIVSLNNILSSLCMLFASDYWIHG